MEKQWFILETDEDYENAMVPYERLKNVQKGSLEHKEKMLLVTLIQQYEEKKWDFPELDPVIKIRMEDFGYRPADLAEAYGDKGTVSKVLIISSLFL